MDSVLQSRYLPVEVLRLILLRLPARALVRFRCVSRPWRALIDDPDFARFHLTRFKNNLDESRLLLVHRPFKRVECLVICSQSFRTIDRPIVQTPHGAIQDWTVVGSIDGLFMLRQTSTRHLTLWNPSLKKSLILSPSPPIPTGMRYEDLGLGFDPLSKVYKCVRFVHGFKFVAVYTLATKSWKTIEFVGEESSRQYSYIHFTHKTLCFGGLLYAVAKNEAADAVMLVSFDLSTETFASHPLPVEYDPKSIGYVPILTSADAGSSLAMLNILGTKGSMWVLADIATSSWTRRYTFPITIDYIFWDNIFLYLTKNDEILWNKSTELSSYNLVSQEEKLLLKHQVYMGMAWPYVESLIWF